MWVSPYDDVFSEHYSSIFAQFAASGSCERHSLTFLAGFSVLLALYDLFLGANKHGWFGNTRTRLPSYG